MKKGSLALALCSTIALVAGLQGCSSTKDAFEAVGGPVRVNNGDFETGTAAPWAPWLTVKGSVSQEKVHGGKYSLQEDSGKGSMYQDVAGLRPGLTYMISAWVCGSSGANTSAQIAAYDPAANIATFSPAVKAVDTWLMVSHRITAGARGTVRLHLFHNEGPGQVYWDDVEIVPSAQ